MKIPKAHGIVTTDQASRENIFKNIVMNIIIGIRERKKRPKLSDFMKVYKDKKGEDNAKEIFQNKMKMLYSGESCENDKEDEKYNKLAETFQRIQKQLAQQQQALSNLVKRVNNLSDKRDKREDRKKKGKTGPDADIQLKPKGGKNPLKNVPRAPAKPAKKVSVVNQSDEDDESPEAIAKAKAEVLNTIDNKYQRDHAESENINTIVSHAGKAKTKIVGVLRSNMLGDVGSDHGFDEEDTARQTQDEMGKLIPN